MKRQLFISLLFVMFFGYAIGQCPGCMVDFGCTVTPAKPTLCPDTLPPGTAMQYYDQDITFYMPAEFVDQGTGFDVTLNRIEVTGVVGIPYGLSFESSSATNNFYPSSNPPTTEYGCAKFCGTPLLAGNYVVTVYVKAYVTVLGMNQTQDDSFEIPITIFPSSSGNTSFTISNPSGCAPLQTEFTANYQSQGNPHYSYDWDFGNGNTSDSEFPTSQTYTNSGSYVVSLQTTIDTLGFFLSSVSIVGSTSVCDDIFDGPDYYIKIFQGSTEIYNNLSDHVTNSTTATFTFPTITLANAIYNIEVWDEDSFMGGGATGDDWCATVSFLGQTPGYQILTNGGTSVSFTIDHPILNFNDTDTITVYPNPIVSEILVSPNDTSCLGDTIMLSIADQGTYQWYMNGQPIVGSTDSIHEAALTGNYAVSLMNQYGCIAVSDSIYVNLLGFPPTPTFWQSGNVLETMLSGYNLQWFLNGTLIPGATQQTYTITESGLYSLEASNSYGCATLSYELYANYTSIDEISGIFENLLMYPNPADQEIFIQFNSINADKLTISVTDIIGQVFIQNISDIQLGQCTRRIDLSKLPAGMYIIILETTTQTQQVKLIKE